MHTASQTRSLMVVTHPRVHIMWSSAFIFVIFAQPRQLKTPSISTWDEVRSARILSCLIGGMPCRQGLSMALYLVELIVYAR